MTAAQAPFNSASDLAQQEADETMIPWPMIESFSVNRGNPRPSEQIYPLVLAMISP
jgi:hypothetical protein